MVMATKVTTMSLMNERMLFMGRWIGCVLWLYRKEGRSRGFAWRIETGPLGMGCML